MSSPIAIPRSASALSSASSDDSSASYSSVASSSSSPATSYSQVKGLYVPIHKRASSPSLSPECPGPDMPATPTPPPRTYSIAHLLSLRTHGYTDSIKATLREGPAPEVVMNRKMRKSLEFAEVHHRRVSPTTTTSAGASADGKGKSKGIGSGSGSSVRKLAPAALPAVVPPSPTAAAATAAVVVPHWQPTHATQVDGHSHSRFGVKFSGRASHTHTPAHPHAHPHPAYTTSERKRQPLGGLQSNLDIASWRTPVPRLALN